MAFNGQNNAQAQALWDFIRNMQASQPHSFPPRPPPTDFDATGDAHHHHPPRPPPTDFDAAGDAHHHHPPPPPPPPPHFVPWGNIPDFSQWFGPAEHWGGHHGEEPPFPLGAFGSFGPFGPQGRGRRGPGRRGHHGPPRHPRHDDHWSGGESDDEPQNDSAEDVAMNTAEKDGEKEKPTEKDVDEKNINVPEGEKGTSPPPSDNGEGPSHRGPPPHGPPPHGHHGPHRHGGRRSFGGPFEGPFSGPFGFGPFGGPFGGRGGGPGPRGGRHGGPGPHGPPPHGRRCSRRGGSPGPHAHGRRGPPPPHGPPPHHRGPHGPHGPHGRRPGPPPSDAPAFDMGAMMAALTGHPLLQALHPLAEANGLAHLFEPVDAAANSGVDAAPGNATRRPEGTPGDADEATLNGDGDTFTPPMDIFSNTSGWTLHIALPGAKKEDIGVNWDADRSELNITGVIYRNGDSEFLKGLVSGERKVGVFERIVKLPLQDERSEGLEVDGDGIVARLEDGVLVVRVPRVEKGWTEVRKVDVE